jgi:predicted  nucleic acid-binding Zn-ribbon protein
MTEPEKKSKNIIAERSGEKLMPNLKVSQRPPDDLREEYRELAAELQAANEENKALKERIAKLLALNTQPTR